MTGNGFFDFKGRDGLIKKLKQFLPMGHYLIDIVSAPAFQQPLERLSAAARNYAAHESQQSKDAFKKAAAQNRVGSAGSWLKRQNRFEEIVDDLKALANQIHTNAPY